LTIATVLAILNAPRDPVYRPETYLPGSKEASKEQGHGDNAVHRHLTKLSHLKEGLPLPRFVFVLSPWVDLECKGKSWEENNQYCYLRKEPVICQWYAGHHTMSLTKIPLNNPLISPVNGKFQNFPPLLIQVGSKESLFDEAALLSEKAREAGVEVTLETYQDMGHVFQGFGKLAPISVQAFQSIAQHIQARIGKQSSVQAPQQHTEAQSRL